MSKAHLKLSEEPLTAGGPMEAACGTEIQNSFFVLALDTAFTVGHSIRQVVSANTLLFCQKCFRADLTGRYLYAVTEKPKKMRGEDDLES